MTLAEAKRRAAMHGYTLSHKDGEYRYNVKGGTEATAGYTSDLDDALGTIRLEAERTRPKLPTMENQ